METSAWGDWGSRDELPIPLHFPQAPISPRPPFPPFPPQKHQNVPGTRRGTARPSHSIPINAAGIKGKWSQCWLCDPTANTQPRTRTHGGALGSPPSPLPTPLPFTPHYTPLHPAHAGGSSQIQPQEPAQGCHSPPWIPLPPTPGKCPPQQHPALPPPPHLHPRSEQGLCPSPVPPSPATPQN